MLRRISLRNVGPVQDAAISLGRRLNIVTGDNGLGKSLLLDVVWYALARRWPADLNGGLTSGRMVRPLDPGRPARIAFDLDMGAGRRSRSGSVSFRRREQGWAGKAGLPCAPGVVVHARGDGGFCVWDSVRNHWDGRGDGDGQGSVPAFVFSPREVWDGLRSADGCVLGNGLIHDWTQWQRSRRGWEFPALQGMLKRLSPPWRGLEAGEPARVSLDDARDIPTIRTPRGDVPVSQAGTETRRILALAYFLTWSLSEHFKACRMLGLRPAPRVTLLLDDVDAHLHPKWQRGIMGGLIGLLDGIPATLGAGDGTDAPAPDGKAAGTGIRLQILATTHSPLVMSSLEGLFDQRQDRWFAFSEGDRGEVRLSERTFQILGEADSWLTSDAFGLSSTRSIDAEEALREYNQAASPKAGRASVRKLERLLPDTDPFWRIVDFQRRPEEDRR